MTRNLDNRVEVTCPILDSEIKKEINDIFNIYWSDNIKSRLINLKNANLYKSDIKNSNSVRSQLHIYSYYKQKIEKKN